MEAPAGVHARVASETTTAMSDHSTTSTLNCRPIRAAAEWREAVFGATVKRHDPARPILQSSVGDALRWDEPLPDYQPRRRVVPPALSEESERNPPPPYRRPRAKPPPWSRNDDCILSAADRSPYNGSTKARITMPKCSVGFSGGYLTADQEEASRPGRRHVMKATDRCPPSAFSRQDSQTSLVGGIRREGNNNYKSNIQVQDECLSPTTESPIPSSRRHYAYFSSEENVPSFRQSTISHRCHLDSGLVPAEERAAPHRRGGTARESHITLADPPVSPTARHGHGHGAGVGYGDDGSMSSSDVIVAVSLSEAKNSSAFVYHPGEENLSRS